METADPYKQPETVRYDDTGAAGAAGNVHMPCIDDVKEREMSTKCLTNDELEDLIAKFEEETGIKVNVTYYSSSDEMVAKVTASSPDTYDIICDGVQYYDAFREKGIIDEIDTSKLKNIGNIDEAYRYNEKYDPEGKYGIPYMGAGSLFWTD